MPRLVQVTCPYDDNTWWVDLDDLELVSVAAKAMRGPHDPAQPPAVEQYRVQCPRDGEYFVIEVAEEDADE